VFVERLDWLAKNPRFTQRFAMHVGALCREMTHTSVAQAERLHNSTVKDLDTIYMPQQVARAGLPAPRAIGVDEIAIRKGHDYRIVVSDLDRRRPIWVGGKGRTEADMDLFFAMLGAKKTARIQLAAMDMWKPFRASLTRHAPQARVIFDKFHIVRHLGEALDAVRRSEYRRLAAKDRAFIKGQRYTLLSHLRTFPSTAAAPLPNCSRPTSGSTPPTCSKSPLASSGTTRPRAGPAPSSRAGNRASSGSGSRPMRSSRR
jgi:transposase